MLPSPTPLSALTRWQADPVGICVAVGVGLGYLLLVRRLNRRGDTWPAWRTGFAVGSCVLVTYLTCGWVGAYSRVLLYAFTLQVTLLFVVAPALLAFARPISLVRQAFPRSSDPIGAALRSPFGRVAASPATGPIVIPVVLALVFFSGLLSPTLSHRWAADLLELALLVVGFVVALPLGGDDTETSALAIAAGIFLGLLGLLLDAVPGIVLRLSTHPLALQAVTARHAPWAPSLLSDQQSAGAILWFLGEVLDLPFLGLMVARWIRADRSEAERVDAFLDAQALAAPAGAVDPDALLEPGLTRPWWETDPDRLGARRAAEIRRNSPGK